MEKRYGLIGRTLGHSHSPLLHRLLGGYDYQLYPLEPQELPDFLRQPGLGGLNVTIPYKQTVMENCDTLSQTAQAVGSVNTLLFGADGAIHGHNTDCGGLLALARRTGIGFGGRKVVILGNGGTGHTAAAVARAEGAAAVVVVSRTGPDNYSNLHRHADADLLINTTPVGMYPGAGESPVSLEAFPELQGLLDVVYNPLRTRLVQEARQRGIPAAGGLYMLAAQAAEASALFQQRPVEELPLEAAYRALLGQVRNLVLVGMPGCGKSTVGRLLAQKTGRALCDTDAMVARRAGCSIPELIAREGEAAFRGLESQAVAEAALQTGVIIATGGGAVLAEENRRALLQNGVVFYIRRPLEQLSTKGRPLSVDLPALYRAREPIYRALAHHQVDSRPAPQQTAEAILEVYHEDTGD